MSSTNSSGFSASKCIDGVICMEGMCTNGASVNLCHTKHTSPHTTNPWLSVQLSHTVTVSKVKIYNRGDCCQDRLANYQVWVGSVEGQYFSPSTKCVDATAPATAGPFDMACDPATGPHVGTYVTIVLPGSGRKLNLGEVYIFTDVVMITQNDNPCQNGGTCQR